MIEGKQIVGGLAQLIGSLLSWIHQGAPNICPGAWPWTVSLAGALLAISPLLGAIAVALLRKGTGNNYGVGMLATLGGFGLFFGFVVPWLFAELLFQSINTARVGGTGVSLSGLSDNICVFSTFGTQGQYLTGGQIGYQALTSTSGNTVEFIVYLVVLGAVPLLCLLAVIMQQRIALRRGPRWPGRLMWLPFLACILFTLLFPANLMAQLWLGFLPASLLGIVVVMLLGQPSWSVIQQAKREAAPPPPATPALRIAGAALPAGAGPLPTRGDAAATATTSRRPGSAPSPASHSPCPTSSPRRSACPLHRPRPRSANSPTPPARSRSVPAKPP